MSWTIPQEQRSDDAPVALQERLLAQISDLAGVTTGQSAISVPGARGLMLNDHGHAPPDAFLVPWAGEFAHPHPTTDGFLHLALPPALATDAVVKRLGSRPTARRHPTGPRDGDDCGAGR